MLSVSGLACYALESPKPEYSTKSHSIFHGEQKPHTRILQEWGLSGNYKINNEQVENKVCCGNRSRQASVFTAFSVFFKTLTTYMYCPPTNLPLPPPPPPTQVTPYKISGKRKFKKVAQGSYRSWKTWKVMEFVISISRSGKSWNLSEGHGKSWKSNMFGRQMF